MNVFATGFRNQPWVWQVTILCFVLGILLAGSLQTIANVNRAGTGNGRVGVPPAGSRASTGEVSQLQKRIAELTGRNTALENLLAGGNDKLKAFNDELQKAKLSAGWMGVRGPGVVVTLQDSKQGPPSDRTYDAEKYLIHDWDLQQTVNELNDCGAEAISINNQRVVGRTSIRCVGSVIQVNSIPLGAPYEIRAIGDPATMLSGLNMRNGLAEQYRRFDGSMIRIDKRADLAVAAYTGTTELRYAVPDVKDKPSK